WCIVVRTPCGRCHFKILIDSSHWLIAAKWCFVRTADLYANCSEGLQADLNMEMSMMQHLLLSALGVA
ncbi:MAG: hypothetical protein ACI9RO_002004, partial [Alteromonas macleodii]